MSKLIPVLTAVPDKDYLNPDKTIAIKITHIDKQGVHADVTAPYGLTQNILLHPKQLLIEDDGTTIDIFKRSIKDRHRISAMNTAKTARQESNVPKTKSNTKTKAKSTTKPKSRVITKTGCSEGTIGHEVGLIMLKISPKFKDKCVAAIRKMLAKDFYDDEAKIHRMGGMWFFNHVSKMPHIYKGYKTNQKKKAK